MHRATLAHLAKVLETKDYISADLAPNIQVPDTVGTSDRAQERIRELAEFHQGDPLDAFFYPPAYV
ncbi:hypothetical protein H9P43_002882 [Blastocladiella emersonii ATCC 22665]|nr:hypothetical protein H9P43_002882 [Blastocladiella emersonii ATCC 22665]